MLHIHTKVLELFDEKLDLVFLGIAPHVAEPSENFHLLYLAR